MAKKDEVLLRMPSLKGLLWTLFFFTSHHHFFPSAGDARLIRSEYTFVGDSSVWVPLSQVSTYALEIGGIHSFKRC